MKLLIITVLIMMLILQGCQSFAPVGEGQKINLNKYDAVDIKLDLVDGTEITSNAYTHKLVTEPSDFIMGIGALTYKDQKNSNKSFYEYNVNEFDSIGIYKVNNTDYVIGFLKSDARIIYENDSYLKVGPEDGTGYFIRGKVKKGNIMETKTSRVEENNIQNVEIKKVDGAKAAGIILLVLGILVAIGAIAMSNTSLGGFGNK